MIRWEQEGHGWVGFSGELPVAKVVKDVEAERESWNWQIHAIKRPNGWRKPVGHGALRKSIGRNGSPPRRFNPTWPNSRVGA